MEKEYDVFELVEKLKSVTPVIKEKEVKTKNTEVEQPALKKTDKPDKAIKDLAADVSVEPVDFSKKPEDKLIHPKDKDTEQKQLLSDSKKLNELRELIQEMPSLSETDKELLLTSIDDGVVMDMTPDLKSMIAELKEAGINRIPSKNGMLDRGDIAVQWVQNCLLPKVKQTTRKNRNESILYICNSCSKTFRNTKKVCTECKSKNIEEIKSKKKVSERIIKSYLNEISVKVGDIKEPEEAVDDKHVEANKDSNIESDSKEQSYLNTEDEESDIEVPDTEDAAKNSRDTMSVLQKIAGDEKLAHSVRNNAAYLLDQELKKLNKSTGANESKLKEDFEEEYGLGKGKKEEKFPLNKTELEIQLDMWQNVYDTAIKPDDIRLAKLRIEEIEQQMEGSEESTISDEDEYIANSDDMEESKVNEFDDDKESNLKVIAKGIEKREFADAVASRNPKAKVVSDSENPEKFMVVTTE